MNRLRPQCTYDPWESALDHVTKNVTASIVECSVRDLRHAVCNVFVSQTITMVPAAVLLWHAFIAKRVMENSVSVSVM